MANRLMQERQRDQLEAAGSPRRRANNPRPDGPPAALGALQDLWWAILNSNEFILNH
jgi:hypothetical protein